MEEVSKKRAKRLEKKRERSEKKAQSVADGTWTNPRKRRNQRDFHCETRDSVDDMANETTSETKPDGFRYVAPYKHKFQVHVKARWFGKTLLQMFVEEFGGYSSEYYAAAIQHGFITINHLPTTASTLVKHGDLLQHVVVVNKPSTIPVHPCGAYRHNSLVFILANDLHLHPVFPVHRLDRLTSGLLVLAKSADKAAELSAQLVERSVQKFYFAKVLGRFPSVAHVPPAIAAAAEVDAAVPSPAASPSSTSLSSFPFHDLPRVFPTHNDHDEEKYHFFAKRRATYVAALPRGLGPMPSNWQRQYALFPDTPRLFDRLSPLLLQPPPSSSSVATKKKKPATDNSFLDYLVRQVRRFDPHTAHVWMTELARGDVSIPALVQSFSGIPFEQWRASPESKCPLVDLVATYNVGLVEASWFIRINVIYQELNEMRRDRDRRVGDWFYHPKRFQRRSMEWTEQLIWSLHTTARQCFTHRLTGQMNKNKKTSSHKTHAPRPTTTSGTTSGPSESNKPQQLVPPTISPDDRFRYVLQLAEYHFHLRLVDSSRFFNGLLSLYQKSLLLNSKHDNLGDECWPVLPMPVNHLFLVLGVIIKLLPAMLQDASATKLLVKITLAHFQVLLVVESRSRHHERLIKEAPHDKTCEARLRNQVDMIQVLDDFHSGNSTVEVADVYKLVKIVVLPRYLSTTTSSQQQHQATLQDTLVWFLKSYEPQHAVELTAVLELFSLLIRRRLFVLESFIESVANGLSVPPSSTSTSNSSSSPSAVLCQPKFQFEFGPTKGGFNVDRLRELTLPDRLRLYLWQLPRGDTPLSTHVPMELTVDNDEYMVATWMELVHVTRNELKRSRALERVMILTHQVFQPSSTSPSSCSTTSGAAMADTTTDPGDNNVELDQMAKIFELYSLLKKLSGHDKGRYAAWLLRQVYDQTTQLSDVPPFFILNDLNTVEHVLRLTWLLLELTDVLSLLQLLIHCLRHAPVYVIKSVVLPILDRHHATFYACHDILSLIQAFEYRCMAFRAAGLDPDDSYQTIALFICRIYQRHSKALDKALQSLQLHSPPEVLTKAFFTLLKDDLKASKDTKDGITSLEGVNQKFAFPKDKDTMAPDMQELMARVFAALQRPRDAAATVPFTHVMGTVDKHDVACRDAGVDQAVQAILRHGQLTSQQRIFMFRVLLTDVMDKWMAMLHVATSKAAANGAQNHHQQSIYVQVPQYMHRCVHVLRDVIDGHEEGERKLMRDTLLTWLHKEVITAFNGVEPTPKGQAEKPKPKNVFVKSSAVDATSGKDTFAANLKGHLDKIQYGLKLFLMALVVHGIVDLTQVLRFVLVPGFPKNNALLPRQERGVLASTMLFDCTNDVVVRELIFADKAVKERHVLKENGDVWFMTVIMKLLCRPLHSPPEVSTNRVHLLKADEIFAHMTKWSVHRGGCIYLEVEVKRQHLKVSKRIKPVAPIVLQQLSSAPNMRNHSATAAAVSNGLGSMLIDGDMQDENAGNSSIYSNSYYYQTRLDTIVATPTSYTFDKDDKSSAADKIGTLVVHRLFGRCVRPQFLAPPALDSAIESKLAAREAADVGTANLYASILCSIYTSSQTSTASYAVATSLITAAVSRALEVLEADAKTTSDDQYQDTFNGSVVAVFLRRVLSSQGASNNLFVRYMRSMKVQLAWLLQTCQADNHNKSAAFLAALRRKVGLRLQLVSITASVSTSPCPHRNGIVKLLFSLLGTSIVSQGGSGGGGGTLFEWIIDLIPVIPSTVFADHHYKLQLPPSLARRVYAVFPKSNYGAVPLQYSHGGAKVDPWGLLEGVPDLPSRSVTSTAGDLIPPIAKRMKTTPV
ncbi:hypothetical protein B5M09_002346 [Aphanomyces astaci]|uniref:Pseudouridine synthase RsuA/RluA-like domain-containing protein n=1 Tax=Aphanomyces astaci TaxID=112090 RepID=A0A425D9Q0_APHAT|nr:hypothetical protein B5M09_002346 [Aphanomyces astaci]